MKPLRVLHVIPSVAPARGGPSQAVIEIMQALRRAGVNAEIATTNDNGPALLDVPLNQKSTFKAVPIWFFPRFSPPVAAIREFAFSASFTQWLWQNIHHYDLIHVHAVFSYASTVAMAIARLKQVPYLVRPLGQLCEWSLQQSAIRKQLYLNLIEKSNLEHSQAVHFTSHQEKAEANSLRLTSRGIVIPHGLEMPPLIPLARKQVRKDLDCPGDDIPIILFLSRLHPKKGLDYLISALGKLLEYPFIFVIAGRGEPAYEDQLRKLVATHYLSDRTHFLGFVSGEQKHILLQGADLFVLTSHSENFGVVVLEAMAAGLPVLLTPGVALAAVAQQNNLGYFPELNPADIANALLAYFKSSTVARGVGQRARKFVLNHYTWDAIAPQLIDVYREILDNCAKSNPGLFSNH